MVEALVWSLMVAHPTSTIGSEIYSLTWSAEGQVRANLPPCGMKLIRWKSYQVSLRG